MADNFLERKRRDYEERKSEWLKKSKNIPKIGQHKGLTKPADESL